ncbi:MAG: hypothetical protein JSS62_04005 [Verrucomicrobia bacterium]|nr:hypothetical protein [Verrucomicrobiota bacterium]MBS0647065.1 hypothetical protein [Verrucomicrobiota bacterium]
MACCFIYDFGYYFSEEEYQYYNRQKMLSKHITDWQSFNKLNIIGYFPLIGAISAFYHGSIALSATKSLIKHDLDACKKCSILAVRITLIVRALFELIGIGLACLVIDAIATAMRYSLKKNFHPRPCAYSSGTDL